MARPVWKPKGAPSSLEIALSVARDQALDEGRFRLAALLGERVEILEDMSWFRCKMKDASKGEFSFQLVVGPDEQDAEAFHSTIVNASTNTDLNPYMRRHVGPLPVHPRLQSPEDYDE